MTPKLSILCASVRPEFLDRRLLEQVQQTNYQNQVEFLILHDNDWRSTGRKLQMLVEMSRGDFVMQMSDDDIVSPRLLPRVLQKANRATVDTVTYNVRMINAKWGAGVCRVNPDKFSKGYQHEIFEDGKQFKMWHPLMPTRRELYNDVEWLDSSWGEDIFLAEQIGPKLKRWVYIPEDLYFAFPCERNPYRKNRSPRYASN